MSRSRSVPPLAALPMHLTLAMLPWLACSNASQISKSELQNWKPPLPGVSPANPFASLMGSLSGSGGEQLLQEWQKLLNDPKLAQAASVEAKRRLLEFLGGVERYQSSIYERTIDDLPCVHTIGAVRLLDAGGDKRGKVVLLIPSLINRYTVLDLEQKLSLARYLASKGARVFIVDWAEPGPEEMPLDVSGYVLERLLPLVKWITDSTGRKPTLAGYCMGGLLALALAVIKPQSIKALACFATPWDFSVPEFPLVKLPPEEVYRLRTYLNSKPSLPAEYLHTLFHWAHPYAYQQKMRDFLTMKADTQDYQDFLAIERWVQDGVPMTRHVAVNCLIEWMQENATANLLWRVGGRVVDPASLSVPTFIAVPRHDTIVPSACAMPLALRCVGAHVTQPDSGHVGMMVGKNRKPALWDPFLHWLANI